MYKEKRKRTNLNNQLIIVSNNQRPNKALFTVFFKGNFLGLQEVTILSKILFISKYHFKLLLVNNLRKVHLRRMNFHFFFQFFFLHIKEVNTSSNATNL